MILYRPEIQPNQPINVNLNAGKNQKIL